jgi:hypothetical protein
MPEHDPQRPGLRCGQPFEVNHGTQQPVQRRERQRRLGLHSGGAQHARRRSVRRFPLGRHEVAQEGGLADARLSLENQHAGLSGARLFHQGGKGSPLPLPAVQHPPTVLRRPLHAGLDEAPAPA